MAAEVILSPSFRITFDILNKHLTFTDTTTNRGEATQGTFRITNLTSGTILYDGSGWNATSPTWETPPIHGSGTAVWEIASIDIEKNYLGTYKFEYWTRNTDGVRAASLTTRTYTLDYTSPTVSIEMTVLCSTSQLKSEDTTEYSILVNGVEYEPGTLTRSHTITKPAGSGYTGTLGSTTDAIRIIGGGETAGTRLWTRTWQTNIVTTLVYNMATWGTIEPTVQITDTVYGDDNIFAQCDATVCALAACYVNMLSRWIASLSSNFAYREDNRDKIIQANALWSQLQWYERCGTSVESTILALQTLLAGENCNCTTNTDEVSVPITPWGALVGIGGSGSASTFQFTVTSSSPTSLDGNDGDVWINSTTWYLYKKESGSWVSKGSIKGSDGAAGGDATNKVTVLLNDTTETATPAGTSLTPISYNFQINNTQFTNNNDFMEFTYDVKLATNQNGKTLTLKFAGTDVLTYFTDELVVAGNDRIIIKLKVNPVSDTSQHLTVSAVRSGTPGVIIGPTITRNHSIDLNTTRSVCLYGTNSVASVNDIICDSSMVILYNRDTTLIPPVIPLGQGRGLVSQSFTATEGQQEFVVTTFEPNDSYIPLIDNVVQSQSVVQRSGYVFRYEPGLSAGQVLLIVD